MFPKSILTILTLTTLTKKWIYQNLEIPTNYCIFAEKSKKCEQSYNELATPASPSTAP